MTFDDFVRSLNVTDIGKTKIEPAEFIELFKEKKAVLLDIREDFEREAVRFPFAIEIPLNKLPDNLDKLPKDKIIACACPNAYRSVFATKYLNYKGFNARNLMGGLAKLFGEYLSGNKAKVVI
jgi:rhodanese-related sulfurtransferase